MTTIKFKWLTLLYATFEFLFKMLFGELNLDEQKKLLLHPRLFGWYFAKHDLDAKIHPLVIESTNKVSLIKKCIKLKKNFNVIAEKMLLQLPKDYNEVVLEYVDTFSLDNTLERDVVDHRLGTKLLSVYCSPHGCNVGMLTSETQQYVFEKKPPIYIITASRYCTLDENILCNIPPKGLDIFAQVADNQAFPAAALLAIRDCDDKEEYSKALRIYFDKRRLKDDEKIFNDEILIDIAQEGDPEFIRKVAERQKFPSSALTQMVTHHRDNYALLLNIYFDARASTTEKNIFDDDLLCDVVRTGDVALVEKVSRKQMFPLKALELMLKMPNATELLKAYHKNRNFPQEFKETFDKSGIDPNLVFPD